MQFYPESEVKKWVTIAKPIYKKLLSNIEGISEKNPMSNNITTSFVIISIWLASGRKITTDLSAAMKVAMDMKVMKWMYSMVNMNTEKGIRTADKLMKKDDAWNKAHPEETNKWDIQFNDQLHKDGYYYDFTSCPIASFCKEHGYDEITPVLCDIDYETISMMHAVLHRDYTIGKGDEICDYWIVGDQIENPQ